MDKDVLFYQRIHSDFSNIYIFHWTKAFTVKANSKNNNADIYNSCKYKLVNFKYFSYFIIHIILITNNSTYIHIYLSISKKIHIFQSLTKQNLKFKHRLPVKT